ncbi:MAG: hypothetical protein C0410_00530 [Anaerolinea sp.]|nr:hypothetical protein [Anaerolinea sp.]
MINAPAVDEFEYKKIYRMGFIMIDQIEFSAKNLTSMSIYNDKMIRHGISVIGIFYYEKFNVHPSDEARIFL